MSVRHQSLGGLPTDRQKKRRKRRRTDALIQVIVEPSAKRELEAEARAAGRTVSGHVRFILEHRKSCLTAAQS